MATENAYEWLDGNMHRNYPILDSCTCVATSGIRLPSSFLVDIDLSLPAAAGSLDRDKFFISGIMRSGDSFVVEISYHGATDDILCGRSNPIPVSVRNTDDIAQTRTFGIAAVAVSDAAYEALEGLSGELIVGSCIDMQSIGNLTFPYERDNAQVSSLLSVRIHTATSGIASVGIIDESGKTYVFTTDFVIQAGDGIGFTVDTDANNVPRLNISRQATSAELAAPYRSVEDVETAIFAEIGQPILRINGMAPTENGDFTLAGDDCTKLSAVANGLVVQNPCSKPCCGTDTPSDVQAAVDNIQDGMARLDAFYENLMNLVNSMQSKLTSLIVAGRK